MSDQTAHVDPLALTEFADKLSRLADAVEQLNSDLGGDLNCLGQSFRDQDYQTFCEHFRVRQQYLSSFVEQVRQNVPKLRRDAETIAANQAIRIPE